MTTLQDKADAMAETIRAIAGLCTYQHESKEDFIGRVRAVLGDDPDLRVSNIRKQRDDLLAAFDRLSFAAECRDNTMGDPCRLIEVKAELAAANQQARTVIASVKGGAPATCQKCNTPDLCREYGRACDPYDIPETSIPAIVFYPAGSLGEEVAP